MANTIVNAPGAANVTVSGAASTTAVNSGIFTVIAGEPGAGSQLSIGIPGSGRLNGVPFQIKAAGFVSIAAGTFTTSVQPLIYASTTAGFTAAAASAIYSAAAVAVTVASASATVVPWNLQITMSGDSTSGKVAGTYTGTNNNGAINSVALAIIANAPTSVNFSTEPPLQFAAGVSLGTTSNTFPTSTATSSLTYFAVEA